MMPLTGAGSRQSAAGVVCCTNGQHAAGTRRRNRASARRNGTSARARAVTRGHCRHTMNGRFAGQTCSRMPGRVRAYRLRTSMVRRGSTVRVRQRALQKPRKSRLFLSSELARTPICGTHGAVYGAFRSRTPARCRRKRALLASNEQTSVQPQARGVPEDVEMHFPLVRVRRARLQPDASDHGVVWYVRQLPTYLDHATLRADATHPAYGRYRTRRRRAEKR